MSGIYIKGMEMPKDGSFEVLVVHDNGIVTKGFFPNENEHTKAIFIPDHGRLIDADALEDYCHRQTKNKWNESTQTSWAYAYASFESDVEDAPTVIPAEDGTDFFTKGHLHLGNAEEGGG